MAKMFEDSLRTLKIIEDDSPKFVTRSIIEVPLISAKDRTSNVANKGKKGNAEDKDWLEIIINKI
jgi:hypothetical protein